MSDIGQPNTGKKKSIPKVADVKADDSLKLLYKKVGNNHNYPCQWADKVTLLNGATEVVVASGVNFHGFDLATYGNVVVTPLADVGYRYYIDKDTGTNVVKIVSTAAVAADIDFDVQVVLGGNASARYIEGIYSHGTNSVTKVGSHV